ncbi:hypothetical protein [Kitasatospora sp. MBT66]|uniref:hypothetical protein n=1 Tax=Kitasatospora sp. MBT66 TaxID=1444769 RepID=UPI0005B96974|nr:hypothetical protein [Kitasatospora sp. MBT66]
MPWRVQSRTDSGRWVEREAGGWDADPDSSALVRLLVTGPLALTPVGPYYDPTGPQDDVAVFLAAMSAVPAPAVSGTPPQVPTMPLAERDGAVH